MSDPANCITPHIRWMVRHDMDEVVAIDAGSFAAPWDEDAFRRVLALRHNVGLVAEYRANVVGFVLYENRPTTLHLIRLAVNPDFRRLGVGRAMVDKLVGKLCVYRRNRLQVLVDDASLPAHLLFRAAGLIATDVVRGAFDDRDGYWFERRVATPAHAVIDCGDQVP